MDTSELLKNPIVMGVISAMIAGLTMYIHNKYMVNNNLSETLSKTTIIKYSLFTGSMVALVLVLGTHSKGTVLNNGPSSFNPRRW